MREKESAKARNKIGAKYKKEKNLPSAMRSFAYALEIDPKNKKALSEIKKLEIMMSAADWFYYAAGFQQTGKYAEALRYYDRAPQNSTTWNCKGVCRLSMGGSTQNYELAIVCFNKAIELQPDYQVAWEGKKVAFNQYGNKLLELGNYDKALEYYLKSEAISGPGVTPEIMSYNVKNAWILKGSVFYQAAKYSEALDCYKRALVVTPAREDKDKEILGNMKEAAHKRGIELHNEGNYTEAIQCFDLVLAIDSQHKDAWFFKGCGLDSQGNCAEAIQCFDKVLAIDSKDKRAWSWKATALSDQGYYTDAMSCFNIALTLDSNDSETWGCKGFSLYKQGKYAEAMQCFDKELALSPEDTYCLKNKGLVLFCQGHYDNALEYFKKAIKINPKFMPALQGQAVWFFYREEKQKSEQLLAEVELLAQAEKSKSTLLTNLWCQRGDLFFSIKALPQAKEAFKRAQSVMPRYFYAEQRLRDIKSKQPALPNPSTALHSTAPSSSSPHLLAPMLTNYSQSNSKLVMEEEMASMVIPKSQLTRVRELGKGGFGTVYEAVWKITGLRSERVAIKELTHRELSSQLIKEFKSEVKIHAQLQSPTIVKLFGITEEQPYCMVMEYMELGSLQHLLDDSKNQATFTWDMRLVVAKDILTGLVLLHVMKIVHADMKPPNVLLDANYRAKIADFGLASIRKETGTRYLSQSSAEGSGIRGSLLWMAPELLQDGKPTAASDMYALGLILWQMASFRLPFATAATVGAVVAKIVSGVGEKFDEKTSDTPDEYKIVAQQCWHSKPSKRLTAKQALDGLEKIQLFGKNPTVKVLFPQPSSQVPKPPPPPPPPKPTLPLKKTYTKK